MSASQWALLVLLSILWGGSFLFNGIAVAELPAFTLVLARVGLAALTLAPMLWIMGLRLPATVQGWAPFAVMAVVNKVVPFLLIYKGQQLIASGLASVLNATTPVWSLLLVHAFTADDKLKPNKLVGALLGIAGVAALIGPEALLGSRASVIGMLLVLGGAISYGVSAAWGRRLRDEPPLLSAFCQLACATLMLAPLAVVFDQPWTLPVPSPRVVAAVLGIAVLSTAIGYIVFFRILTVSGPTNVMLVTLLIPLSAIALGVLVLGETLQLRHVVGALVIGSALLVIDGRVAGWLGRERPTPGR